MAMAEPLDEDHGVISVRVCGFDRSMHRHLLVEISGSSIIDRAHRASPSSASVLSNGSVPEVVGSSVAGTKDDPDSTAAGEFELSGRNCFTTTHLCVSPVSKSDWRDANSNLYFSRKDFHRKSNPKSVQLMLFFLWRIL
jgi:hypothetical protein